MAAIFKTETVWDGVVSVEMTTTEYLTPSQVSAKIAAAARKAFRTQLDTSAFRIYRLSSGGSWNAIGNTYTHTATFGYGLK